MASIAAQYPEAKALCDHTNSAANEARTIWFGFLTYGTFLLVAVSGTTHKMLFLQTPISLPVLSINLDLVGFYVAAPLLLVGKIVTPSWMLTPTPRFRCLAD